MLKRSLYIAALSLLVVGCSGGKVYQSWPSDAQINGTTYRYHNAVQLNLPATMFHGTKSVNWMEWCQTKLDKPQTEAEFLYPYADCVSDEKYEVTTMGSVASQFVTPVVTTSMYAGALAFGLHQVGRGLGKSGTTVNQDGAKAEATGGSNNSGNKNTTTNNNPQTHINSHNSNKVK